MSNPPFSRSSRTHRQANPVLRTACAAALGMAGWMASAPASAQLKAASESLWPHWEGRIGVLDLPTDGPLQPVSLSESVAPGLKLQSKRAPADYYLGAGYTAQLPQPSGYSSWRRITRVFQGDQGVDALLSELRLRPVVKFSVNYAF